MAKLTGARITDVRTYNDGSVEISLRVRPNSIRDEEQLVSLMANARDSLSVTIEQERGREVEYFDPYTSIFPWRPSQPARITATVAAIRKRGAAPSASKPKRRYLHDEEEE